MKIPDLTAAMRHNYKLMAMNYYENEDIAAEVCAFCVSAHRADERNTRARTLLRHPAARRQPHGDRRSIAFDASLMRSSGMTCPIDTPH